MPRLAPFLALAFLFATAQPGDATPTPVSALSEAIEQPGTTLNIVYTGFTGGLSSGRVDYGEIWPFFRPEPPRDFETGGFQYDNAFARGQWVIVTDQGPLTLEDFQAFFVKPVKAEPAGTQHLLSSDYMHVLDLLPAGAPSIATPLNWPTAWLSQALRQDGSFRDVKTVEATRFRLTNGSALRLTLLDLAGRSPAATADSLAIALAAPAGWEMLPAGSVALSKTQPTPQRQRILAIGRPQGDGLRRAALQRAWKNEAPESTLSIDLGNLLEAGASALSADQRAISLAQVGALGLDALVPAETELGLELEDWKKLSQTVPILAANLEPKAPLAPATLPGAQPLIDHATSPEPPWPAPIPVLNRKVAGIHVAIIGLVDDKAAIAAGVAGPRTPWRVSDPLAKVREILATYTVAGSDSVQPDLVVIATNVRDDRLQTMRHLNGAHLVLSDLRGLPGERMTEKVAISGAQRARVRTALMIARSSQNRVGRIRATFQFPPLRQNQTAPPAPNLVELRNTAQLVTDELPHDTRLRAELNALLDKHQRARRELLLPDLREAVAQYPILRPVDPRAVPQIGRRLWGNLLANRLRRPTGAEVAIVRIPAQRTSMVGAVSRLVIEGWLDVDDRLVQLSLPGKALKALAAQDASEHALAFSGFDAANNQVLGQAIVDDELYRVTTTDLVANLPAYAEVFGDRQFHDRWFPGNDADVYLGRAGDPLSLRDHVIDGLVALKARHRGAFKDAYFAELVELFQPTEAVRDARWSVRFEDGELLTNNVAAAGDPAYSQVRNTRVTAPSSQALGGKGKLAVLLDSPNWAFENRVKAAYKRATLNKDGQTITQETEDEIVLTSEWRLKRLALPVAGTPLTPFVSGNYTTEFKPDEDKGVVKPRRQELAAIGGLLYAPGNGFKELRAGGAMKNDLANPALLEPGLYASGGWEQALAPWTSTKLKLGAEVFRYFSTPTDTPDRLGLAATFTAGVAVPIWERFTLNAGADYFVYAGKVPTTAAIHTNVDFKVGIGYTLVWKPGYGIWF